jgi:hypothetical protein
MRGALFLLALVLSGCRDASRAQPDGGANLSDTVAAVPAWTPRPIRARPDPRPAADTTHRDSLPADSLAPSAAPKLPKGIRPFAISAADSARWPVASPPPLPGALLPENRIVAYYGNVRSTRMGVLGALPRDSMLAMLEETATEWAKADTARSVMPALHLIVSVAQADPGTAGKYRLRMGDSVINEVARWAEERGWILFLDVQPGKSTVEAELKPLVPFLARPYVHLALDPEFAMTRGGIPGQRVGTLDAKHVNYASALLAALVDSLKLPPKVLIIHRFKQGMLTNHAQIRLDPRVQLLIQMDGYGKSRHKQDTYRRYIVPEPVEYTGLKLFYKNDRSPRARQPGYQPSCPMEVFVTVGCGDDGLMTPEQVLAAFYPVPVYIQYQ